MKRRICKNEEKFRVLPMKENKGISFIKQCMEILDNTSQEEFDRICEEKKLDERFADFRYEDHDFTLVFPEKDDVFTLEEHSCGEWKSKYNIFQRIFRLFKKEN